MGAGHGHGPEAEHQLTTSPAVRRTMMWIIAPLVIEVGERVMVVGTPGPDGAVSAYAVVDHDRSTALLLLMALFAAAAVAFVLLLTFILPAIARGESPLPVAIVGAAAIMFAVLYLTHGVNVTTSVAVLGTLAGIIIGTLGLIAAVPITTALAARVAVNRQTASLDIISDIA